MHSEHGVLDLQLGGTLEQAALEAYCARDTRPEPLAITGTPGPGNKNRSRVPDDSVEFIGGPVPGAFGFFSKVLKTHHRRKTCFEIWSREPISL